jgi:hypothetical protein
LKICPRAETKGFCILEKKLDPNLPNPLKTKNRQTLIVFPQQWTILCLLSEGAKAWRDWLTTYMAKCVQLCLGGATKEHYMHMGF